MSTLGWSTAADEGGAPLIAIARRRWWVIALAAVVAVAIAAIGLALVTPQYQATATLQAPANTGAQTPIDVTYIDRLLNTYEQVALQPNLRAGVAHQLHRRSISPLSVTVEANTELLQLSATDPSPQAAQRVANAAAAALVGQTSYLARSASQAAEGSLTTQLTALTTEIVSLQQQLHGLSASEVGQRLNLRQTITGRQTDYQALTQQRAQLQIADAVRDQTLTLVQPALLPTSPSFPRRPLTLALALALGLLGGVGLAYGLERFLPRLYTVRAIETAADATVVAAIPQAEKSVPTSLYNGGTPIQEAFGMLAVQVLAEAQSRKIRTILVTSPTQGDGKSTVAANLAAELARSDHHVLLIDADMRAPNVHRRFGVHRAPGLSDLLQSPDMLPDLSTLLVDSSDVHGLRLLLAGDEPSAPARLLASKQLPQIVDAVQRQFDFVIFDAPPLVVSDPMSVARLADLVLLVVAGNAVPDRDIQAASRQLQSIGVQHLSVVVNRWHGHENANSYAYKPTV